MSIKFVQIIFVGSSYVCLEHFEHFVINNQLDFNNTHKHHGIDHPSFFFQINLYHQEK